MAILTGNDIYKYLDDIMCDINGSCTVGLGDFYIWPIVGEIDTHINGYEIMINGYEYIAKLRFYLNGEDWILDSQKYDGCTIKYATIDTCGFIRRTENTSVPYPFTMDDVDLVLNELHNRITKNRRKEV